MLKSREWDMTQRGFTMRPRNFWQSAACALLLIVLAIGARAEDGEVKTGWLDLEKGARDSTVGAQLIEIKAGDTAGSQQLTLAIPKNAIANPDKIEEVVVMGQRPEKPEKPEPLDITYKWVADYDNDNYGLVIRLSKNTNWPIRLYMNSDPDSAR
jgi:hypothetical protein